MKISNLILVIFSAVSLFLLSGCAGSMTLPTVDEMQNLKGQSTESIIKKYGQPTRKTTDAKGSQRWEYKRPAVARGTINSFVRISSFGILSDADVPYVDILRLNISKNRVTSYTYNENVANISTLGLGEFNNSDFSTSTSSESYQKENTEESLSKMRIEKEQEDNRLETSSKKAVKIEQQSAPKQIDHALSATMKIHKVFSKTQSSITNNKLSGGAANLGMTVSKKKNETTFTTTDGSRVHATIKQLNKDVSVELSATGELSAKTFGDMCDLLKACE